VLKALICRQLSGPAGLEIADLPLPEPGPGELRIEVAAAGINFADSLITTGKYQVKPALPFVPGFELAGTVDALGDGVTGFKLGDRVMATPDHGAFAEAALVLEKDCFALPAAMDWPQAAGFPIAYGTAHAALRWRAELKPGETLLVHGASGGSGLAAVEVGKALGAHVIATASSAQKRDLARTHGADHCLDSTRTDLRGAVKELTGGMGADVVFDPVGGDLFEQSLRCIAFGGRLLVIGFAGGRIQQIPANILMVKTIAAIGLNWSGFRNPAPERLAAGFKELFDWTRAGRLNPEIHQVLPLARGAEAIELLTARKARGKVVLDCYS
jgi:NADPH2:quinone reductase